MSITTNPEQIIETFDRVIKIVYGANNGREYENRNDKKTAQDWIDKGADLILCMFVFVEGLRWMYENGKEKPKALAIFDDNVEYALNREANKEIDEWEKSISQWRARVKNWQDKPHLWDYNNWGEPPDQKNTRAPKMVLAELGIIKT